MTQCQRILQFIEDHGSITQMDANRLKITRLAARIYDLKRMGINIAEETVYGRNEYGAFRYSRYSKAV